MHFTFAIDPNILTTWQSYSYVVQDCGVPHGRLIADYPNRWRKMVSEAAKACAQRTELDYTRIEYHLQHEVPAKLVTRNGAYNHQNNDWLAQAESEHAKNAFRAIVSSTNPRSVARVLKISALDKENDPYWQVEPYMRAEREPTVLASAARFLFAISKKVKFVDPNFGLEALRFRISLNAFLSTIRAANSGLVEVEYHFRQKSAAEFFAEQLKKPPVSQPLNVPRGMRVRFVRWKQLPGGDDLHPRYLLTDRGGMTYDVGLDAGKAGEKTKIYRMSEQDREETWNQYETNPKDTLGRPCPTCFEFVDDFTTVGN